MSGSEAELHAPSLPPTSSVAAAAMESAACSTTTSSAAALDKDNTLATTAAATETTRHQLIVSAAAAPSNVDGTGDGRTAASSATTTSTTTTTDVGSVGHDNVSHAHHKLSHNSHSPTKHGNHHHHHHRTHHTHHSHSRSPSGSRSSSPSPSHSHTHSHSGSSSSSRSRSRSRSRSHSRSPPHSGPRAHSRSNSPPKTSTTSSAPRYMTLSQLTPTSMPTASAFAFSPPKPKDPVKMCDLETWHQMTIKFKKGSMPIPWTPEELTNFSKGRVGGPFKPSSWINKMLCIYKGSVVDLAGDAIVNAANSSLLGGGGVDGAIHTAAGPELFEECKLLDGCDEGDAKRTFGYELPCPYVIHAVGPIGEKPEVLTATYEKCLSFINFFEIRTVAFCGISTGIFGYPLEAATHVALSVVRNYLESVPHRFIVKRIVFACFKDSEYNMYLKLFPIYFPPDP
ncbi:Macro domain [Pelomyxa schiedti]|nr:Macro domain [Pelomyxa schiedti]